jgi:NADPH2 dehydrogenase
MPNLLAPIEIAGLRLRKRIVNPPQWSGQAQPDGSVTDLIIEYHRKRAAAGCGLVIVEHAFVHALGRHTPNQIGVHEDGMLKGLSRLAAAVRAEGAVVCQQISHSGSRGSSAHLGQKPVAPSAVRHPSQPNGEIPEELSTEGIAEVVLAFGDAAARAIQAGFQAVEVHAAHGFLLSEFLSPLTNQRTDAYGGSLENRSRVHMEVLAEVRRRVPAGTPVFVRLGAHDEMPGGVDLEMSVPTARRLEQNGADLLDISGGLQGSGGIGKGPGFFVSYAEAIKAAVKVPVLVTGGIKDPAHADSIVREGKADLVGIGRAMLEDADWARKAIASL